ncbi:hypothetical protein EDB19DRAFT_1974955 [Suillus lakei]|nr:hypothetical protein EDB19DRAFT_1985455 [Suillus lakei]KAG1740961.1 hypothetical protein EDB19DRAFT_1974955 [Suillus lakei]
MAPSKGISVVPLLSNLTPRIGSSFSLKPHASYRLVVTSTWALGVTGTFLGDYFGILMDHHVQGFPFNVLRDPMYVWTPRYFLRQLTTLTPRPPPTGSSFGGAPVR